MFDEEQINFSLWISSVAHNDKVVIETDFRSFDGLPVSRGFPVHLLDISEELERAVRRGVGQIGGRDRAVGATHHAVANLGIGLLLLLLGNNDAIAHDFLDLAIAIGDDPVTRQ